MLVHFPNEVGEREKEDSSCLMLLFEISLQREPLLRALCITEGDERDCIRHTPACFFMLAFEEALFLYAGVREDPKPSS